MNVNCQRYFYLSEASGYKPLKQFLTKHNSIRSLKKYTTLKFDLHISLFFQNLCDILRMFYLESVLNCQFKTFFSDKIKYNNRCFKMFKKHDKQIIA